MKFHVLAPTVATISSLVIGGMYAAPASAVSVVVDFKSLGNTNAQPTLTFNNGSIQFTVAPINATQNYVTASSAQGLCLFANSTDTTNRCGLFGQSPPLSNYNNVGITPNVPGLFTGFNISQVLFGSSTSSGFINPNPPGTGQLLVRRGSETGPLLETIELANIVPNTTVNFQSPLQFNAGEYLVFQASGSNASIRLSSLNFTEVPGPLPLLGAGAAFGWSRRIRRRTALLKTKSS